MAKMPTRLNGINNRQTLITWGLGLLAVAIILYYGGRAFIFKPESPSRLVVYAFSTQEEVLTQSIFPAFETWWQTQTGDKITLEGVFGPSGRLAGQINLGAPADVAILSNEQHANWLKVGHCVQWNSQPVVVSTTPMVIVTRQNNPPAIATFGDLAHPGLALIHADPQSSGAGEWAVLAEYGSVWLEKKDETTAQAQVKDIWKNVQWMAPSARAALTLFEMGAGDALITYEQDARQAQDRDVPLTIVYPPHTIIAQHVAVVVDTNVTHAERPIAEAFIAYLTSDAGQAAFAAYHLRPANSDTTTQWPALITPFTIADLGGWSASYPALIELLWQQKIEPQLTLKNIPDMLNSKGE